MQIYLGETNVPTRFCIFRNNIICNVYDTGLTYQSGGGGFSNCFISNNKIFNCGMGLEFFVSGDNTNSVQAYGNMIVSCTKSNRIWDNYKYGDPNTDRGFGNAVRLGSGCGVNVVVDSNLIINCDAVINSNSEYEDISITFKNNTIIGSIGKFIHEYIYHSYNYEMNTSYYYRIATLEIYLNNPTNFSNNKLIVNGDNFLNGDSEHRPQADTDKTIGLQYFDTTLGKPIFWNYNKWVDATGADV